MESIFVGLHYVDDAEQKFMHAHFPAMPRVGDSVTTPPPQERKYEVTEVCFQCEGPHPDETSVLVVLRRRESCS